MIPRLLEEAARRGARLLLVIAGCNALFILLALFLSPTTAPSVSSPPSTGPPSQPHPLPSFPYLTYQLLLHVFSGFAAGAVSLDPAVALVGAALGPLIDLDHIGFFAGLPVEARAGHSFLMVALIVLVDWRLHFWERGTRNLFLFVALEYSVHLAVAPPGFPLLAPLSEAVVYFPRLIPAALAAVFAVGFFFDSARLRMRG